jgi:predicted TIM-barrel fold metal-dependent hydrolase
MKKYYDIHNHLFNKNFLAKELLYRLMKEMKKFLQLEDEKEKARGLREPARGLKNVIAALKRYTHAIKVFTRKNSTAVYEELNKTYKGEFILTPLTFDLTYCFAPSADRDGATRELGVKEVFESEMEEMFGLVEQKTRSLSRDFNDQSSPGDDKLWNEYLKAKARFMKDAGKLKDKRDQKMIRQDRTRGITDLTVDMPDSFDGFKEQIKQITELKNHPDYKEKVFPFLAVDPRRPGIAEYAKANVGKGKLFIGVKLYCPNGYSPTDPLLFGPDGKKGGIYAFCEENGIPVTAHNSDGGFATFSDSVIINGLIHVNGQLRQLKNDRVTFKSRFFQKGAVYERAATLNHPLIWEKVVEKYPGLILNLAHFGGGQQLNGALDHPENEKLWSNRIIALLKDKRYKVYTDISCFYNFEVLRKFFNSPVYREIKTRTLYGSDFILLLLFENDFNENVRQFKDIFGSDFDIIASSNPEEFLKHVI